MEEEIREKFWSFLEHSVIADAVYTIVDSFNLLVCDGRFSLSESLMNELISETENILSDYVESFIEEEVESGGRDDDVDVKI